MVGDESNGIVTGSSTMQEAPTMHEAPAPAEDADRVPPVAICVPLYQKEPFIGAAIESALAQTFADFELIVLDNASTDRSAEVVRSFDDPRLVLVQNETTISGQQNFNKVVRLSRAPLVKVLSADDLIHPTSLERQIPIMDADPDLAVVSSRQDVIDENGALIAPARSLRTRDLVGRQVRATVLRRTVRHGGNPVGAWSNVLFRRTAFDAARGAPEDGDFFSSDISTWLRMLEHGDFYGIPETLCSFRINSGSSSAAVGKKGIEEQRRFIAGLRQKNPHLVRRSDTVYGALRYPLTRLRQQTIFAAAGPSDSSRRQTALRVMSLGRYSSNAGSAR